MLHFSVLLFAAIFNVLLPIAILFGLPLPLLFVMAVIVGIVIGYAFRAAIASELSKLSVSTIAARLEAAAKQDYESLKSEAIAIAADLKKNL